LGRCAVLLRWCLIWAMLVVLRWYMVGGPEAKIRILPKIRVNQIP
jgi:hypothetical protein